ncbi:MAG: COX15/CtaA family protein, partial [Rhodobacteraceae bacterium]|nr:COX15/CtaA family protein [Paracoccaceae bacterium]
MTEKRNIFEDVSADKPEPAKIKTARKPARRGIAIWLMMLFALVALMILVGGMTRLTDSGLSITEWQPFRGAMPPSDPAAWDVAFEKYQTIPEYRLQNNGMTLA